MKVDVERCESCGRAKGERHKATTKRPSIKTMERWASNCSVEASDGCEGIEPDGYCEHGHASWLMVAGVV